MMGYVGNSKWHYHHYKQREFIIGWFYRGQMEKRNIVRIYDTATLDNEHYSTDNGQAIPKFLYRHLVQCLTTGGNK